MVEEGLRACVSYSFPNATATSSRSRKLTKSITYVLKKQKSRRSFIEYTQSSAEKVLLLHIYRMSGRNSRMECEKYRRGGLFFFFSPYTTYLSRANPTEMRDRQDERIICMLQMIYINEFEEFIFRGKKKKQKKTRRRLNGES